MTAPGKSNPTPILKTDWSHLEKFRHQGPYLATYGSFFVPAPGGEILFIIAADGTETGWEHVSLHARRKHRTTITQHTPTWDHMCFVKGLFWEPTEAVMQLHPAEEDYVNCHPHVLHLWKPVGQPVPMPPKILV